ncbi:MAG: hypothetical protein ABI114_05730 [Rhodanobacter sp.]
MSAIIFSMAMSFSVRKGCSLATSLALLALCDEPCIAVCMVCAEAPAATAAASMPTKTKRDLKPFLKKYAAMSLSVDVIYVTFEQGRRAQLLIYSMTALKSFRLTVVSAP